MLLITLFFPESDPHAQLDDVKPIDQDHYRYQELEDERDDAEPDEVHTICDPEETEEISAPQTSQASSCDLSQKLDKPSQPKLHKFPINTNVSCKKKKRDLSMRAGTTALTG